MARLSPRPLTAAERRARRIQAARLARELGFVGRIEYRHIASLLGAMHCPGQEDRDALVAKATVELVGHGEALDVSTRRLQELWDLLEALL